MNEQLAVATGDDPVGRKVAEARRLLQLLNFDEPRYSERSALTLLALLGLGPKDPWSGSDRPMLATVDIISWISAHYEKTYKPNTRETIRRFTLHQFVDAGLVVLNPDKPTRPTNSPKSCYQIEPRAYGLLSAYGQVDFEERLRLYLVEAPGLIAKYAAERELHRIPVTLPDGSEVALSPGGQNTLIADIVSEFCPRFTPGGVVLYLGDADSKWAIFHEKELAQLGIVVDAHGKMPDLVVYLPDRNWLVLLEAASSHGPVDAKRHGELKELFKGSTAGLVFISALPSRAELRKYLKDIAWETDVWCADDRTHLIHFNGERFLGPYS